MKVDSLVLLSIDMALLLGIFVLLARIQSRLERIEKRLWARSTSKRQKNSSTKKD